MRPVAALAMLISLSAVDSGTLAAQATADRFFEKAARFLASKGYRNDPTDVPEVWRIIGSRIPSEVPGLGTDGPRLIMGIERKCTDSLKAVPNCVRIDMLEVFAGTDTSQYGVIPLTFAGPRQGAVLERGPSRDVLAEAELTARAVHTKVFRPAPLATLAQTPEHSPDSIPRRPVPFILGSFTWASKELQRLGFPPVRPALLDTLHATGGPVGASSKGQYRHLGMATGNNPCPKAYPKDCRRLELISIRLWIDSTANETVAEVTPFTFLRVGPDSTIQVPTSETTTRTADQFLQRFKNDPAARPYEQN